MLHSESLNAMVSRHGPQSGCLDLNPILHIIIIFLLEIIAPSLALDELLNLSGLFLKK